MFAFAWLVAPCYTALLRGAPNGRRGCGLPPCMQSHEPVHDAMFRPAKVAPAGIQHMADKICLVSTDAADAAPYLGIYRKGVFGHSGKNKYQRHGYYEQVGDPNKIVWWDGEGGVWTVGWRTVGGRHYAVDSLVGTLCVEDASAEGEEEAWEGEGRVFLLGPTRREGERPWKATPTRARRERSGSPDGYGGGRKALGPHGLVSSGTSANSARSASAARRVRLQQIEERAARATAAAAAARSGGGGEAAAPEEAAAEALGRCDALESALKSTLRVYEAAVRRSEEAAEAAEAAREAFGVAAAEEEAAEAAVCEALAGLEPQGGEPPRGTE
ncbi:hypothetical protein EMIHUDRAFT_111298 [Emiliania huxleyi CCMP1516]|uniref:Uncharacterized protein n=2 Tax=Emiliania huxleyi TaxID=2903 RepID=A0A0D3KFD0_EMIH1|nr:hypothetical protein EMIHUDRAFT_111298 [Emiliania huxleyi CCMP1516]EOD34465.1 hypothetical protein EMIHUDRAFT_111298 [Emiliania huxleyi CCMP1516]|eukprot:XP_005786894.1 hypothetical protein EMIHUDRAFT_111298 [Emiliania huxleyi CCMP1516]